MPRLDRDNPNSYIGIILLVILAIFVLPARLPAFIANFRPDSVGGMPCGRLPAARDLAAHQSILARAAVDPLRLALSANDIDAEGELSLRLTVSNKSLGSVPILFQNDNLVVAGEEDESNGLGLLIRPAPSDGTVDRTDADRAGYDEADIRFLGPWQTCAHDIEVTASATMISDGGTARAWYRMVIAGEHAPQSEGTQVIFPDQGLAILSEDVVYSAEIEIKPRE